MLGLSEDPAFRFLDKIEQTITEITSRMQPEQ
jgi:hypothetical protein